MLKPQKVWKVGDDTFADWHEAQRAASRLNTRTINDDMLEIIRDYGSEDLNEDAAERIVSALNAAFRISRRNT